MDEWFGKLTILRAILSEVEGFHNWLYSEEANRISSFNDLRSCALNSNPCSIPDGHLWV